MIRYAVTFPGAFDEEEALAIREQLLAAENDRRWIDVILQEGGTIARLNERRRPSVATRNARKRLR